jgi:hypothetical protein
MTEYYQSLLENNKKWVERNLENDPDFFNKLADGQQPPLLKLLALSQEKFSFTGILRTWSFIPT